MGDRFVGGRDVLRVVAVLLVGTVFGVVVVALNHAGAEPFRSLSLLTGGGAGWAALAVAVGAWFQPRPLRSVAGAVLALLAAVASYYAADAVAADSPLATDLPDLRFWALAALVVGPPLGLVGWRARRDGTWTGLAARVVVPLGFAAESVLYLDGWASMATSERLVRVVVVAVSVGVISWLVVVSREIDDGPASRHR